jgi:predicted Zn finger-like uncharacterized protein
MIIACPACATRYDVPESAVGANGRTVRCAKCRHSWFEDGSGDFEEELDPDFAEEDVSAAAQDRQVDHGVSFEDEAGFDQPDAEPADPELAETELADAELDDAGTGDDPEPTATQEEEVVEESSPAFAPEASPAPRRSKWRLWAWAAVIVAVLGGATAAAASYWGLPDWMPVQRPALAVSQPGLKLDFPADRQERRQLPNGTEFFGARGTITNVDSQAQPVPPILIVLRDARDRIVFSWEVAPPKRSLAPGESITVNEAMTDVPRSARVAEIGWKPV